MFDIAYLDSTAMAGYNKTRNVTPRLEHASEARIAEPNSVQRALAFHDTLTRFILPLCTSMRDRPNPESPILSAVYLVDISAFGIKQAWDLRSYAQDISKLLATSFPEVVDTVFVSDVWSLCSGLLVRPTC
jgi:hypothetical protein